MITKFGDTWYTHFFQIIHRGLCGLKPVMSKSIYETLYETIRNYIFFFYFYFYLRYYTCTSIRNIWRSCPTSYETSKAMIRKTFCLIISRFSKIHAFLYKHHPYKHRETQIWPMLFWKMYVPMYLFRNYAYQKILLIERSILNAYLEVGVGWKLIKIASNIWWT